MQRLHLSLSPLSAHHLLGLATLVSLMVSIRTVSAFEAAEHVRRPVSIAVVGSEMWVANRDTGSISTLALSDGQLTGEVFVAASLADLELFSDQSLAVAVDPRRHEVVLLRHSNGKPEKIDHKGVPHTPVSICRTDLREFVVASQWARQLTHWSITQNGSLQRESSITLPFAPRLQCVDADGRYLFVADAFGPYLAVIDLQTFTCHSTILIPGHNIRGMAITDHGRLLLTHQQLNEFVPTTRDHVFWGTVMSNLIRSLPIERIVAASTAEPRRIHGSLFPLGREGNAAGDPGELLLTQQGDLVLAINGTGELAQRTRYGLQFDRMRIATGTFSMTFGTTDRHVYVASRFDDRVSKVDLADNRVVYESSLGPRPALTPAQQGEAQFHNSRLSLDGWLSCHSCHSDGHTGDFVNDNFGDDSIGAPKRIPSLLGTADTAPWSWRGSEQNLAAQIRKSLYQTMRGGGDQRFQEEDVQALNSFVQSLSPAPGIAVAQNRPSTAAVERGRQLFETNNCLECHPAPNFAAPLVVDVGLSDELGQSKFNPPSLRGVSQRRQFFHDGSAKSLKDVFLEFAHPRETTWSDYEVEDLVHYLETL